MAGSDYIDCANLDCEHGHKLIYAAHMDREFWPTVYCDKCYGKLVKKIEKLEKARKRGR
jgi:hypothetical protein